jgi:GH24 family phage-related lysozyme (muramidase)
MAIDRRITNKPPSFAKAENAAGIIVDSGPYTGIVRNNIDPARAGRLQVWIPDFGGDPDVSSNWRTVRYASPFMGHTFIDPKDKTSNNFSKATQSYGFWMVPPDIGVEVLVIFVAGDPARGFWFACVTPAIAHSMLPSIATTKFVDFENGVSSEIKSAVDATKISNKKGLYPTTETNVVKDDVASATDLYALTKPIHVHQYRKLLTQGLQDDDIRGLHTSSSQRESPSNVFGFSTPGLAPDISKKSDTSSDINEEEYTKQVREGGHVFVMDDGAAPAGVDNKLVKIRTSNGHQILLHDSNDIIYIINSKGNAWVELTGDGQVNVFTDSGFNLRTQGTLNLHADLDININAGRKLNIFAGAEAQLDAKEIKLKAIGKFLVGANKIGMKSSTALNLTAGGSGSFGASGTLAFSGSCIGLNTAPAPTAEAPTALVKNKLPEATKDAIGIWKSNPEMLETIVAIAPTHEPFDRTKTSARTSNADPTGARTNNPNPGTDPDRSSSEEDDLIDESVLFLRRVEGFTGMPYDDAGGSAIGIGHTMTAQEKLTRIIDTGEAGIVNLANGPMTEAQAASLLRKDLPRFISAAKNAFGSEWDKLSIKQQSAIVSYAFNTGEGGVRTLATKMIRAIKQDQFAEAGQLLTTQGITTSQGRRLLGLFRRRQAETGQWNTT